ncbi:MAG: outer membrane beta-barrel protein [Acidobacteriota bacterium]
MRRDRAARIGMILILAAGPAATAWGVPLTVEARAGLLSLNSGAARDVYGMGPAFGLDVTIPLWKQVGLWAGADYYRKKGRLTYTLEDTTLRVVPLFAGLKVQSTASRVKPYAALGAGLFAYKESNVIGSVSGSKIGFVAQAGVLARIKGPVSVDIHARYTSVRVMAGEGTDAETIDLGGLQGGLGVAIRF